MWKPRGLMRGAMTGRAPPPTPWGSDEVTKFVSVLKRQWLLYDLFEALPPTRWPFIIPKTSEKVSLILRCVKQNGLDGCSPPRFSLRSWEQLSKLLVTFYPGMPLYGTHIDLKNAFWSFVLPELARAVFRLRSGPSGRMVGLGRLPFGSIVPLYTSRRWRELWSRPCPQIFCWCITWMIFC